MLVDNFFFFLNENIFRTDWDTQRIIYSQYFPEKWLEGEYEFKADVLGIDMVRTGHWNLTLRDYSQTTRIKKNGPGLDVRVEIDHIGDMDIHIGNLLRGRGVLGKLHITLMYTRNIKMKTPSDAKFHALSIAIIFVPESYSHET